jgi:hypothetical protein
MALFFFLVVVVGSLLVADALMAQLVEDSMNNRLGDST